MGSIRESWVRLQIQAGDLLWRGGAVSQGPSSAPHVALTFDDGPDPHFTPRIVQVLEDHHAPATFFMVGEAVRQNPVLARRVADQFEIGCHLFSHMRRIPYIEDHFEEEFERSQTLFRRVLGREAVLLRFPWGERGVIRIPELRKRGIEVVHWSVSSGDERLADPSAVVRQTLRGIQPGAIIRFHDGWARTGPDPVSREVTVAALPGILEGIQARGLTCVTAGDLLTSR